MDIETKRNNIEAAKVVATILQVSPNYVRKVVRDIDKRIYTGAKSDRVRLKYSQYLESKSVLINSISKN